MTGEQPLADAPSRRGEPLTPALLCLAFFAVSLPILNWYQFNYSIENIVVETVLETRRDGHWLVPRMFDEPRTRKPPLAVWLSSLSARTETVAELSDPRRREAAYVRLAREVRLPALLTACLTIAGAVALGRVLADNRVGTAAGVITATTFLSLHEARLATPDTHLATWVVWSNVFLARAVVRRERWLGCCGAGICLGLAMMAKGPVVLIQTIAPLLLFLAYRKWIAPEPNAAAAGALKRSEIPPILTGALFFACVALPWPAMMLVKYPGVWRTWFNEVTRVDPANPRPDAWYANAQIFYQFMPWTLWLVLGALAAVASMWRRERTPTPLAFWLFVAPLVAMSFFAERKARYLLPLIPAGAVLSAWPLVHVLRGGVQPSLQRAYAVVHWTCVVGLAGATVLIAAFNKNYRTIDGSPWLSAPLAVALAGTMLALVVGASLLSRGWREWPLLTATGIAMLIFDVTNVHGRSRSAGWQSEMKPLADLIATRTPCARVFSFVPEDPKRNTPTDLSIYLNRVVRPMRDLEDFKMVHREGGDVVVVIGTRASTKFDSVATPPGSTYLGSSRRSGVEWHALLISGDAP